MQPEITSSKIDIISNEIKIEKSDKKHVLVTVPVMRDGHSYKIIFLADASHDPIRFKEDLLNKKNDDFNQLLTATRNIQIKAGDTIIKKGQEIVHQTQGKEILYPLKEKAHESPSKVPEKSKEIAIKTLDAKSGPFSYQTIKEIRFFRQFANKIISDTIDPEDYQDLISKNIRDESPIPRLSPKELSHRNFVREIEDLGKELEANKQLIKKGLEDLESITLPLKNFNHESFSRLKAAVFDYFHCLELLNRTNKEFEQVKNFNHCILQCATIDKDGKKLAKDIQNKTAPFHQVLKESRSFAQVDYLKLAETLLNDYDPKKPLSPQMAQIKAFIDSPLTAYDPEGLKKILEEKDVKAFSYLLKAVLFDGQFKREAFLNKKDLAAINAEISLLNLEKLTKKNNEEEVKLFFHRVLYDLASFKNPDLENKIKKIEESKLEPWEKIVQAKALLEEAFKSNASGLDASWVKNILAHMTHFLNAYGISTESTMQVFLSLDKSRVKIENSKAVKRKFHNIVSAIKEIAEVQQNIRVSTNYLGRISPLTKEMFDQSLKNSCYIHGVFSEAKWFALYYYLDNNLDAMREFQTVIRRKNNFLISSIASAIIAEKLGIGNCNEMSRALFHRLLKTNEKIDLYHIKGGDHAFIVIGRDPKSKADDFTTWGDFALVCDPWTGQIYPAKDILQKLKNYTGLQPDRSPKLEPFTPSKHQLHLMESNLYTSNDLDINMGILSPNELNSFKSIQTKLDSFHATKSPNEKIALAKKIIELCKNITFDAKINALKYQMIHFLSGSDTQSISDKYLYMLESETDKNIAKLKKMQKDGVDLSKMTMFLLLNDGSIGEYSPLQYLKDVEQSRFSPPQKIEYTNITIYPNDKSKKIDTIIMFSSNKELDLFKLQQHAKRLDKFSTLVLNSNGSVLKYSALEYLEKRGNILPYGINIYKDVINADMKNIPLKTSPQGHVQFDATELSEGDILYCIDALKDLVNPKNISFVIGNKLIHATAFIEKIQSRSLIKSK